MLERWLYTLAGKTHGPVPIAEAVRLAAAGVLLPTDKLWPEDLDPLFAFPASATIDFTAVRTTAVVQPVAPPKSGPLPDWLSDVRQIEEAATRKPKPAPKPALPDWLSDVQIADRFIVRARVPAPPPPALAVPPSARTAAAPPPAAPVPPGATTQTPAPTVPRTPAARTAPPAARPNPVTPPVALPVPVPVPAAPAPAVPARDEMGYDPETGQVLDAAKYRRWQKAQQEKAQAQAEASAAGETIYEIFRRATTALENWVDEDTRRPLIVAGIMEAVRKHPDVQRLILSFQPVGGQELVARLWHRLDFLVENRRKFYASRA